MKLNSDRLLQLIAANRLLVKVRWFYLGSLALTGLLNRLSGMVGVNLSPLGLAALVGCSFLVNVLYTLYFWRIKKPSAQGVWLVTALQLVIDSIILTFTIYLAGGIISISFLYFTFVIIASGFFYQYRGVLVFTTLICVLYSGLLWGQLLGIFPYIPRYNDAFEFSLAASFWPVLINTFTIVTSFYMLGFFVSKYAGSIRKREQEVTEERDKVKSVFADLTDGLIYINNKDVIELVNPQAEKYLDIKGKDLIGKNIIQIKIDNFPILRQILSVDTSRGQEIVPATQPDNTLLVSSSAIRNEADEYIGMAKVIRDISREKFVDNMKSEFITIAGHQLRTPLSAIKGALNLLKTGDFGPVSDEQKRVLEQCYQYNDRLIFLINDLLEVSSIEEGKFEYQYESVDIEPLILDICRRYEEEAGKKLIGFNLQVVNNLSPVTLDVYKIKLVLGAILSNAISYTPKRGKVKVNVEFKDNTSCQISVSDSGIGIPKGQQKKMFGKFFRADNALRVDTEGNGLDLFVAKNIIDNHNGKIWFESQEGIGTTFYIELPTKRRGEK